MGWFAQRDMASAKIERRILELSIVFEYAHQRMANMQNRMDWRGFKKHSCCDNLVLNFLLYWFECQRS